MDEEGLAELIRARYPEIVAPVARAGRSRRDGRKTYLDLHYLVAAEDGITHLADHLELTLFSNDRRVGSRGRDVPHEQRRPGPAGGMATGRRSLLPRCSGAVELSRVRMGLLPGATVGLPSPRPMVVVAVGAGGHFNLTEVCETAWTGPLGVLAGDVNHG